MEPPRSGTRESSGCRNDFFRQKFTLSHTANMLYQGVLVIALFLAPVLATRDQHLQPRQAVDYSFCTGEILQSGLVYFAYPGDNTKFYECTSVGHAQIMQCAQGLVWDNSKLSCVFLPLSEGHMPILPTTHPDELPPANPCTPQQIAGSHLYFSHSDPTKFIQCDVTGHAFIGSCPSGLVWNQYLGTCANTNSDPSVGK